MLNYNELKPGVIFILDGEPYEVLEFSFSRMQQRKPVAQTKIRNIITGKILSRNFQHTESFQEAEIDYKKVKFLYAHRDKFVFCELNNPSVRFEMPQEVIVCGGGSRNPVLMAMLRRELPDCRVRIMDELGIDADAKEAVSFALLAVRTIRSQWGNVPSATGAKGPAVLGKVVLAR